MRRALDKLARPFGLAVIRDRQADLVYQHNYAGGYDEFRATQIKHNKRKLRQVWVDETTLSAILGDLRRHERRRPAHQPVRPRRAPVV